MGRLAVGATFLATVAVLTGCSPKDIVIWSSRSGSTTTVTARASAGPDDGGGRDFRVAVVCDGHSWWTRGSWVSVEGPSSDGYYYATAQCFENRRVAAATWERQ